MIKKILFSMIILFPFLIYSQNDFKKGYYIDSADNKIEGYIKPSNFTKLNDNTFFEIDFKKDLKQRSQKISKTSIVEIGIDSYIKIQKWKAKIDDVDLLKNFSNDKTFNVEEKEVFLNVLLDGNAASLYYYDTGKGVKYLYRTNKDQDLVKQLLYKKFQKKLLKVEDNNNFRQQLYYNVKCQDDDFTKFLNIEYNKNELVTIFENYNKCEKSIYIIYEK